MFKDWGSCVVNDVPTLNCLPVVFENVIRAALLFSGVVALFFIILSGIKMITSGGDPKQLEGARQTLTYAIIGLVIVLLSFFIISTIGYITGVQCINQFGFTNCK
jgi:thiosulfate reductase cytochrome b subunit